MLEGAESIEWSAFGDEPRLAEVPKMLDRLRADKARPRAFAIETLAEILSPQSGSSRAGIAAVPFLFEAILDETLDDREAIAVLLADLASGGQHPDALEHPQVLTPSARELHEAIAERAEQLLGLLEARRAALRAAAVLPLALAGHSEGLAEAFEAEKNKTVRASLLVGMGMASRPTAAVLESLETAVEHQDPLVRFGAACGLMLASDGLPPQAVKVLSAAIVDHLKVPKSFPWCGGNVEGMALVILVGACLRAENVDPLAALFADGSNSRLAAAIVRTVFTERTDALRLPSTLRPVERAVLRVATLSNTATDALFVTLDNRGFPAHRESLLRYAGGTEPGVLDEPDEEGRPLWAHLRDAADDRLDPSALLARIPATIDARALAEDALGGYMSLHLPFPRGASRGRMAANVGRAKMVNVVLPLLVRGMDTDALVDWLDALESQDATSDLSIRTLSGAACVAWVQVAEPTPSEILARAAVLRRALFSGMEPLLRPVIERLNVPQRAELLLPVGSDLALDRETNTWKFAGCVPYLDLVPTAAAAELIVTALAETDTPPIEAGVALLRAIGEPGRTAVEAALEGSELPEPVRAALAAL